MYTDGSETDAVQDGGAGKFDLSAKRRNIGSSFRYRKILHKLCPVSFLVVGESPSVLL